MNLHMPQDVESESELRNLAAVPYQIISPGNNQPIIGIYQDSMLGCYQFTRPNINFSSMDAMNLLMMFKRVNVNMLNKNIHSEIVSNFSLLSQILPPLTVTSKNKQFDDDKESMKNSNNVIEILNGNYIRGQLDKGIVGAGTKGLIHRVCNGFGNIACANFIDDLQNIVTEYMKLSAFSVGISDLIISDTASNDIMLAIASKKTEIQGLVTQLQLGVFDNTSGKSNKEDFEIKVNNALNKATSESGKFGLRSLKAENRFLGMYNAGSKGSELNIQQMVACLGQQNVDGKRIPYGFDYRTLPYYSKYDDSPEARGFVSSSYIDGLTPQELFFHAMGGRIGLIDTAVKTSATGYIQRKLVKGMEDLKVCYDMTVRAGNGRVVQYSYGEDSFDTVKVENQELPIVEMSIEDVYARYNIPVTTKMTNLVYIMFTKTTMARHKKQIEEFQIAAKRYTDFILEQRPVILANVFNYKSDKIVRCPVSFAHIIANVAGQQNINSNSMVDITLFEASQLIDHTFEILSQIRFAPPNNLFKTLYYYYLSPKNLLVIKRFNKRALIILLETITLDYKRALVAPGEMVGVVAAQSIGEPTTQMSCRYNERIQIIRVHIPTGDVFVDMGEVGRFCDNLIHTNSVYTFNTGHINSVETLLDNLDYEYYIAGVDSNENVKWSKISHVSRHPVNGKTMRITTQSGRSVETTMSHSHLVRKNNKVEPISGDELKIGMRVPVCRSISTLDNHITDNITFNGIDFTLDSTFGVFIGVCMSIGIFTQNTIVINTKSEYYIQRVIQVAKQYGALITSSLYSIETNDMDNSNLSGLKNIVIHESMLATFVKKYCRKDCYGDCFEDHYEDSICMPNFAFIAPTTFKSGLIQGYMDTHINVNITTNCENLCVADRHTIIKDISLLLNYFDIFTIVTPNGSSAQMDISRSQFSKYNNTIGSITFYSKLISGKYDDDKFVTLDAISGLDYAINYCAFTLDNKIANNEFNILDCLSDYKNYKFKKDIDISRDLLGKYIIEFGDHQYSSSITSQLNILKQAYHSNVIWDKIIDIDISTPDASEFVYDFTVPGNQTFMVDSGIIVHNTLNTFHFAGVASKSNVTRGVPRIDEILSLSNEVMKNPSLTVYLNPEDETDISKATHVAQLLGHTKLQEIVDFAEIYFDPSDTETLISEDVELLKQYNEFDNILAEFAKDPDNASNSVKGTKCNTGGTMRSKWILRISLNKTSMLDRGITMDDIHFVLKTAYQDTIECVYSDYNADNLIFRIRIMNIKTPAKNRPMSLDQSDQIYIVKQFQDKLLSDIVLSGIKDINHVNVRKVKDNVVEKAGVYAKSDIWVLDTIGTNLLQVLGSDYIDPVRTYSNDIMEIRDVLGMEAARQTIFNEITEVIEFDGTYLNAHHISLLCDRMTYGSKIIPITRHGINHDNVGPVAKASFEETTEMFLKAAKYGELDSMRGVSANIMCGQEGVYGTSAFQVVLDVNQMLSLNEEFKYIVPHGNEIIDKQLVTEAEKNNQTDMCSITNLTVDNNVINITAENLGTISEDYDPFQ